MQPRSLFRRTPIRGALVAVALSAVALVPALADDAAGIKADIASVVDGFHAALSAGDKAKALALLHPDVTIFEGGGVERSRAEYESHHLEADMEFARLSKREGKARSVSLAGDTAIVTGESETQATSKGQPVTYVGLETMVLRREGDGWRIVHIHWSARKK